MTRISTARARQLGLVEERSELEALFAAALRLHGADLPPGEREHRFSPGRAWRFDWAWPLQRVAVEVDGGQHVAGGGRHNTDGDRLKLNQAAVLRWRVIHFSGAMLDSDPVGCIGVLRGCIKRGTVPAGERRKWAD